MKYYTSDQHFDHANIIKLCNRPFDNVIEMQDHIVEKWNAKVTKSDDIYILGDFCFGVKSSLEFIARLNGTLHFITGNHDADAMKKLTNMKGSNPLLNRCYFHGVRKIVKDSGKKIVLDHFPLYEWERFYKGALHYHGHTHHNIGRSFKERAYDVGVDGWDFAPVTTEEILNFKE